MTHLSLSIEVLVNAVNLVLSVTLLALLAALVATFLKETPEIVSARTVLRERQFRRAGLALFQGLTIFAVSNGFELWGDLLHIDWYVNEAIETVALVFLVAALYLYLSVFRVSPRRLRIAAAPPEGS